MVPTNFKNPLVQQVADQIEKIIRSAPKPYQDAYDAIVLAGQKLMLAPQVRGDVDALMQRVNGPGDVPKAITDGIVTVVRIVVKESQGKAKADMAVLAGVFLMCVALDWMERARKIPVTEQILAATQKSMMAPMLRVLGVSDQAYATAAKQASRNRGVINRG